jgi:hypothetical protein
MTPLKPTSRQVGALYAGWQAGTERTRELIVHSPQIYLQAQATRERNVSMTMRHLVS